MGCGTGRALYSLMHGDVASFFTFNPALTVAAVIAVAWVVFGLWRRQRAQQQPSFPYPVALGLFGALVIFALLRNIPLEPFIGLAPHAA